jgi:large subunit ribosomal protein L24
MQKKLHIKKGDTVVVVTGNDKGQKGRVLEVITKTERAIVEGVNMISKHTKPSAQNPQGGIVKKEASIHISNLMLLEDGEVTKIGYRTEGDKKVRFSKKSDKAI